MTKPLDGLLTALDLTDTGARTDEDIFTGTSQWMPHGRVFGGHVARGCIVRTTVEILLALLPDHAFSREADPQTGFMELFIRDRPRGG